MTAIFSGEESAATPNHPSTRYLKTAMHLTRYAAILHGVAGLCMLPLWYQLEESRFVESLLTPFVSMTSPWFGLLGAMEKCPQPSLWSLATTSVIFLTGHLLLVTWVCRGVLGTWNSYFTEPDKHPAFEVRFIDWVWWLPAAAALGAGVYWVTYVEMADALHVICARSPFNAWLFRMASTSVAPFFFLFVITPFDVIAIRIHRFLTRNSRCIRS